MNHLLPILTIFLLISIKRGRVKFLVSDEVGKHMIKYTKKKGLRILLLQTQTSQVLEPIKALLLWVKM